MTVAGYKVSKKLIITVVIVLIVAVTGLIVYYAKSTHKMFIGSMYNGSEIKKICHISADFDFDELSDAEKSVMKAASVIIKGMSLTDDNVGDANLSISFPDVSDAVTSAAENVSAETENEFIELVLKKYDTKTSYQKTLSIDITVNTVFINNSWLIVPDEEFISALTGNIKEKTKELYR